MKRSVVLATMLLTPVAIGMVATQYFWSTAAPLVVPPDPAPVPNVVPSAPKPTVEALAPAAAEAPPARPTMPGQPSLDPTPVTPKGDAAGPKPGEPMLDPKPGLDPTPALEPTTGIVAPAPAGMAESPPSQ